MKVSIKTWKGTNFEIDVKSEDTVVDVKITESAQGADVYPAVQLTLIPQGKVLKDETTTLEENKVSESSSFVVTLSKPSSGGASTASAAPPTQTKPSSAGASVASAAPPTQFAVAIIVFALLIRLFPGGMLGGGP